MLPKPDSCRGCPLYQTGQGFVPDEIVEGAEVLVIGQNPGSTEEIEGRPFVGDTGKVMDRVYLPIAGLQRGVNVSVANTIRCRLGASNAMPGGNTWARAISHCTKAHLRIPDGTKLIVLQGAHAFRAHGGLGNVHDWRGYTLPDVWRGIAGHARGMVPTLCTLHLADIPREPTMERATKRDWSRVVQLLRGEWPLPDPDRLTREEYDHEVRHWIDCAMREAPSITIDGEWSEESGRLGLLGVGYPGSTVLQWANPSRRDKKFLSHLKTLIQCKPVRFHNAKADIPVIREHLGIDWKDYYRVEDTMVAHSRLWVEWPHDLEFCASIYGRHRKLKHLSKSNPLLYNAGDVAETAWLGSALDHEMARDKVTYQVYRDDMEVLEHVEEAERVGIKLDDSAIRRGHDIYGGYVLQAVRLAQAYAGWPINIGSGDQLTYQLVQEGFKLKVPRGKRKPSVDKDVVAALRQTIAPFDPKEDITPEVVSRRIETEDAHPLLEARALWTASDYVVTHYLNPLEGLERVHPNVKIHTQNNHRWSWTDPPMATIPDGLRHIFVPDPGWPWIEFDYDGIELRIIACEAKSNYLLEILLEDHDLHTLTCCDVFGLPYPPDRRSPHKADSCVDWRRKVAWRGKDDPRRVFAKTFRYRLNYGGDPAHCGDVPGARTLGLDASRLVAAAMAIKARDPDLARWWERTARITRESKLARDWRGRLRRFSTRDTAEMVRQGYDFGMQAGVQSIVVLSLNQIKREFGCLVHLKYGMHDSMKLAAQEESYSTIRARVSEIVQQPRVINGIEMAFPATFKPPRFA